MFGERHRDTTNRCAGQKITTLIEPNMSNPVFASRVMHSPVRYGCRG